jgi:hypothetical protein
MFKQSVLIGTLLASACAAQVSSQAQDSGDGDAAKAKAAGEAARAQLARELQLETSGIEVLSTEAQTWPDSSLGCGKSGEMAAQVITDGYAVVLKTSRGNYRVHTAKNYAVVCGPATQWRTLDRRGEQRGVPGAALPIRNINLQIDHARADLAKRLNAPENEVVMRNFVPAEWPDSSMECVVAGEEIVKQLTKGYRIALEYRGRIYPYHTDMNRVRACPAIETN